MPQDVDIVSLRGGIDVVTPRVAVKPGTALDLLNFEPELEGGYRRIAGYERTDGRPAPSDAIYHTLGVEDGSGVVVGTTITGGDSGSTAVVVIKSGNVLGITALVGNFSLGETVDGTTVTEVDVPRGIDDLDQSNVWQLAAEQYYRDQIDPVPGVGPTRAAVQYLNRRYAWRAVEESSSDNGFWSEVGTGLIIGGMDHPALASLTPTRVAFYDRVGEELRTYDWDGDVWFQVGASFPIVGSNDPSMTALSSTRVAFFDGTIGFLVAYDFDGANWSKVGTALNIPNSNAPAIAALSSASVALFDRGNDLLTKYNFNGTNWTQDGASLSIVASAPALAALSSTQVAFIDSVDEELRTYSFSGAAWAQVGNSLLIDGSGNPALAAMSATRVAYVDNIRQLLETYDWNGADWVKTGESLEIVGAGSPALTFLSGNDIAFVDSRNDELRVYRLALPGDLALYASTPSGWLPIPFFDVLFFDAGVMAEGEIGPGTLITGFTSGATANVKAFIKNGGGFETDATGYMVIEVTSGAFVNDENIQVGGATKAVANGANSPITMQDGGTFRFIQHNFYAGTGTLYLYGADGVNPAFQFDGETLVPIYFPDPEPDPVFNTPTYLYAHRTHLFLSFPGGQIAHSAPGDPLIFSGLLGAAQFGVGDEVTGMKDRAGDVLAIYTRSMTYGLYGTSSADWQLRVISESFGAQDGTVQKIGTIYSLDAKGIAPLERVEAFGNFEAATVSRLVGPVLKEFKDRVIGSLPFEERNQYRLFFDDGGGLIMGDDRYTGEGLPDFSTFRLAHIPTCLSSAPDQNGDEVILFGDKDGYVYQMERGYNFDGLPIEFAVRLGFTHHGSPHLRKSYRRMYVDISAEQSVRFQASVDLGYGYQGTPAGRTHDLMVIGGDGAYWDVADWNEFFWDAPPFTSRGMPLTGTGQNISVIMYGESDTIRPFVIETVEFHYLTRRIKRRS